MQSFCTHPLPLSPQPAKEELNTHPNTNASQGLPTISIRTFRAASHRVHDAVMAEFGGSLADDSVEAKAAGDEIELEESQSRPQSTERMPRLLVSLVCM